MINSERERVAVQDGKVHTGQLLVEGELEPFHLFEVIIRQAEHGKPGSRVVYILSKDKSVWYSEDEFIQNTDGKREFTKVGQLQFAGREGHILETQENGRVQYTLFFEQ